MQQYSHIYIYWESCICLFHICVFTAYAQIHCIYNTCQSIYCKATIYIYVYMHIYIYVNVHWNMINTQHVVHEHFLPTPSMSGIFTYIYYKDHPNVSLVNIPYMDLYIYIYTYTYIYIYTLNKHKLPNPMQNCQTPWGLECKVGAVWTFFFWWFGKCHIQAGEQNRLVLCCSCTKLWE